MKVSALTSIVLSLFLIVPPSAHAIPRPSAVIFPRDTAMHPSASTEWWYVVGHVTDSAHHSYGFETTFFKFSGMRRYFPASPIDTVFRTDVAITNEQRQRFHQQVTYAPAISSGTDASTTEVRLHAGSLRVTTIGPFRYHVQGTTVNGAIDVTITSTRVPMLVQGGYQSFGAGYTYYYSLTRMHTTGTLTINGRRIAVQGTSWMDHQWGNWNWGTIIGWDWMALQLSDGTDISLDVERTTLGKVRWAMQLSADSTQHFVPQANITPLGNWHSSVTGITYPSGWHVRVPALHLDVVIYPTVRNQEIIDTYAVDKHQPTYWEGSSTVSGTRMGHRVNGKAYVELTGYGAPPPSPHL